MSQILDSNEDKKLLMQFLGQTYSALKQIDKDVTVRSSTLGNASDQFKQTVEAITMNTIAQPTPVRNYHYSEPTYTSTDVIEESKFDANQLEFNFNNSVTAKTINEKIDKLYEKFVAIEKLIFEMQQSLPKKRRKL